MSDEPIHPSLVPDILLGVMGDPSYGPSISHEDGDWVLFTPVEDSTSVDVMCRHKDWDQFVRLCWEYSDFVAPPTWQIPDWDHEPPEELVDWLHEEGNVPFEWEGESDGLIFWQDGPDEEPVRVTPKQSFFIHPRTKKVVVL